MRGAGLRMIQRLIAMGLNSNTIPDIIVVHLGANDLSTLKSLDIVNKLLAIKRFLLFKFPVAHVLFSELAFRSVYRGVEQSRSKTLDKARRRINTLLHKHCSPGYVIPHREITAQTGLGKDGVHLDAVGYHMFVHSIYTHIAKLT